ncbi:MAG TPA: styrene monooxygenase/indole monooxygenase family protein, partial [Caldimonas sp.]
MRKIMIVGAGQSGLQLALGLLKAGYEVTLVSNRSGDDIRGGKVMSSQCMFHTALQIERDLGLNQWERECPTVDGIALAVPHPEQKGAKVIDWAARLRSCAQSVDQRVKISGWMAAFEKSGGELVIKEAGVEDLEAYTRSHDLTIVSGGKGDIAKLFERDANKSPFDKPQRALALTYVKNMRPRKAFSAVAFNLIPTVGEYFVFPALTTTGPCEIMVFEGIPGGPMDCWADVKTPEQHLAKSRWILDTFMPWEAERCSDLELTDANGILAGRFAPTVRKPVATLPSGRKVFGMGDVVVLNDPIT